MPRKPAVGDFVLWQDDVWIVKKVRVAYEPQHRAHIIDIESYSTGEREVLLMDSLAPTSIKTWEAE